jgi:hypothetical protein
VRLSSLPARPKRCHRVSLGPRGQYDRLPALARRMAAPGVRASSVTQMPFLGRSVTSPMGCTTMRRNSNPTRLGELLCGRAFQRVLIIAADCSSSAP